MESEKRKILAKRVTEEYFEKNLRKSNLFDLTAQSEVINFRPFSERR